MNFNSFFLHYLGCTVLLHKLIYASYDGKKQDWKKSNPICVNCRLNLRRKWLLFFLFLNPSMKKNDVHCVVVGGVEFVNLIGQKVSINCL